MTDRLFSDHMSVMTTLKSTKPPITFKGHTYRKIKSIDIDLLTKDLAASDLCKHILYSLVLTSLMVLLIVTTLLWQNY